jgi:uncharacterized protein
MSNPFDPAGASIPPTGDVTSDDKLWSLLSYIFAPLISIIVLLMEDKKNRPFIKYHAYQSLALGLIQVVLWALSFTCITAILGLILFVGQIYWGIQAYNGQYVRIPVLTDFLHKQGWT